MTESSGGSESAITHVVIAQCTSAKRDGEHAARDLYDESSYFRKQRAYAETADAWYIQSAKYGLVEPDDVVESYDTHAKDIDDPETWAAETAADLAERVAADATVEALGGKNYADPLTPELEARGYDVLEPLRGQRIGTRQASLDDMTNRTLEAFE